VAAIPIAGGAQRAPRGVMRALVRVAALGGLVVAAWLLGSGTGHADENLGQPGTGLAGMVGTAPSAWAAPADGESGGRFGVPPAVASTVTRVLAAAPTPWRSTPPPVKPDVLSPLVNAVGVPRLLPPVVAPVSRPLVGPAPRAAIRSHTPDERFTTGPPISSPVRAAAATTPAPAPVRTATSHVPSPVAAHAAAPGAGPLPWLSMLGSDPLGPIPVSPPGSTTSPCLIGGTAGGTNTKSAPDLAVNNTWPTMGIAPMHRLCYLGASDLPRSPAAQPSTSPD
jgi:hypothetical protein